MAISTIFEVSKKLACLEVNLIGGSKNSNQIGSNKMCLSFNKSLCEDYFVAQSCHCFDKIRPLKSNKTTLS